MTVKTIKYLTNRCKGVCSHAETQKISSLVKDSSYGELKEINFNFPPFKVGGEEATLIVFLRVRDLYQSIDDVAVNINQHANEEKHDHKHL